MQQHELPASQNPGPSSKRSALAISRGSSAYPRKRAVTACQVCRARRTKCDQKKPFCSFCESIGAECTSAPAALSTFDPASLAIIERLDSLERKFDSFSQASDPANGKLTAKGLAFHLERLLINRPGFYHRHHGTWLMTRSSARNACILLAAGQLPSTSCLLPTDWKGAVEATIEVLLF
jgi:hypothetical protein